MDRDKRKSQRRRIRYTAWMTFATDVRQGCLLSDISETGARIDVDDSETIPDHFMLWLSGDGAARRACEVVWRKPAQIGVRFERRLAGRDRASLIPHITADADVTERA